MYSKPSVRRIKRKAKPLNLVPILDAVFILIFYLLMSAQFFRTFEIGSDYPMTSEASPPPKVDKALNLAIDIFKDRVEVHIGIPKTLLHKFSLTDSNYLSDLNIFLVDLKVQYPKENSVVVSPDSRVAYKVLINTLDYIRKDRSDDKKRVLFEEIVMGNVDL